MKIGIVTTWFDRGAAYVSKQYADTLSINNNIFIYARGGEVCSIDDPLWNSSNVTWGKRGVIPQGLGIVDLHHFKKWVMNNNLDIIFFNEQQWWPPIVLCKELGVKIGSYIDYYTEETIPFFDIFDFIICNTHRHYSAFKQHKQCYYIPWGTDLELFKPQTLDLVTKSVITFFHSSGFNPYRKGTDFVIKAFSKMPEEVLRKTRLILHSQLEIKKIFPHLEGMLTRLKDKGVLTVFEKTVSPPGLYNLGDVYVYPSRLDGLGLTMAEALACGLPLITSDNGPMNEFVDGKNGQLVQVSRLFSRRDGYYWPQCNIDIDALSESMQYFVERMDEMKKFKVNARMYAEKNLNWKNNSRNISDLFAKSLKYKTEENSLVIKKIKDYEKTNSSWKIRLFLKSPFCFQFIKLLRGIFLKKNNVKRM